MSKISWITTGVNNACCFFRKSGMAACTASLCLLAVAANGQKKDSIPPGLERYIAKVLQTFEVPGVAVSIVKDGKVLFSKGFGVKRIGGSQPVDNHTLFLIASNTKAFTATALAMLVEEGKLGWDDKVIDHLPWFRMSDRDVTMRMTVRDLLVHHSGLPAYAGDMMLFPPSDFSRREILDRLPAIPLKYDFRTTYAYDNILYLAAGELVATVSGMPWEDFIRTRIFQPLGMTESVSRFSEMKQKNNIAVAHARYNGEIKAVDSFLQTDVGDAGDPAGGITSCSDDMARWLITQLDSGRTPSGKRIFNPGTTSELWKIVRPIPIGKVPDELKPSQAEFWGYCLGFRTYNYGQYKVVGHGGALRGFVSQIAMVPKLRLGVAVLTNQGSSAAYWSIIYHVLDYYLHNAPFDWLGGFKKQADSARAKSTARSKPSELRKDTADKPSLPLEKYAGLYKHDLMGIVRITKDSAGLVMSFDHSRHFVADLEYFQYNNFIARFRNMGTAAEAWVHFSIDPNALVSEATVKVRDPDGPLDFDDLLLKPFNDKIKDTIALRQVISAELARHPEASFAIAFKDLSTGRTFFLNENELFHAASTMKTPVLIEAYRQAQEKKFSLNDSVLVKNTFTSIYDRSQYHLDTTNDSEKDLYKHIGQKMSLHELLFRMITMSSNLATNNVIEQVGAENVMRTMKTLGANDLQVLRGVEDTPAFQHNMNNKVTAYDLMLLFEKLANRTMISAQASDAMIDILKSQYFRESIPGRLPADVVTATKSGAIAGICHDSGIVFLPDGRRYVVVLLSKGIPDEETAHDLLATVSRYLYDFAR